MRFDIISIFPEMIHHALTFGVTGKAIENGRARLRIWNPRDYTHDRHRSVDDRPYGGGPGMVMKFEPLHDALKAVRTDSREQNAKVVYLSPQGKTVNQALINQASQLDQLILVAGRYEGVDERFITAEVDEEWSLGDFVISGGELAALIVVDAIIRLLPGVLGDDESALHDSHMQGLLDFPHYTRPETVAGMAVPEVLLGGHHAVIARWRDKQILGRTWLKRPDLLAKAVLNGEQKKLLEEFKQEIEA